MSFYVYLGNQIEGPISEKELMEKLEKELLQLHDFVFPESQGEWMFCFELESVHDWLTKRYPHPKERPALTCEVPLERKKARKAPDASTGSESTKGDWYIQKKGQQYGPFTYGELIVMMQNKEAFGFDLIWKAGQEAWRRLAEVADFSPDHIKSQLGAKLSRFINPRQFARARCASRVVVHDNFHVWRGVGFEIGEGGAAISIPNALLLPGNRVTIHFGATDELNAFNVQVEVVNKRFAGALKSQIAMTTYDVRFLELDEFTKKNVKIFVQRHVVNA